MPKSLLASEDAFSLGDGILDGKYISMDHQNLKMIICLKDRYDTIGRQQTNLKENGLSFNEGGEN